MTLLRQLTRECVIQIGMAALATIAAGLVYIAIF
jgi:hypothetical protein